MKFAQSIALSLFAAASVHAHATFQDLWINGVDKVSTCVRLPLSNSPVTSVSGNDIACNANASAAPGKCSLKAGDTISVEMHQQSGDRSCSNEAIGGAHYGPTLIYMAKVSDAATAVGSSANWFKIAATGYTGGQWGTQIMNTNCGKVTATIPAGIAPGDYLIRAEVIALHVAGSVGGAQFYMSCYQVTVTAGGSASPATVKFPGAYSATDPGILVDIHSGDQSGYKIPGPAVYGGTTGGPTTTLSTTSTTSTSTSTTTVPTSGTVAHYGQCGGTGWTGATGCVSPYTCTVVNAYYYQCL